MEEKPKEPVCNICGGKGYGEMGKIDGQPIMMPCACVMLNPRTITIPGDVAVVTPVGVFGLKEPKR